MSERELHKPGTPGPWEWQEVSDHVSDYALVRSVAPDHDGEYVAEIRAGLEEADAAAIADLWQWIERAERFEEALREIAVTRASDIAADALMGEGRLGAHGERTP